MSELLLGQNQGGGASSQGAAGPAVFDVTTETFEQEVMAASAQAPVIVDFWAPWCGPCKQLMPLLEQAVQASGGRVRLAKVNIDEHPELAQALRVQSVPTVYGFFGGQPVDAFAGMKSPAEIKAFVDKLAETARQSQPDALDIPQALEGAAQALSDNDPGAALMIYSQILQQDPAHGPAYAGIIRSLVASGDLESAQAALEDTPESIAGSPDIDAARTALEMAVNTPDTGDIEALAAAVEKNPQDHQARFDLARAYFAQGQKAAAIDALIEIIRAQRDWEDDKARQELLKFFEAMGPADPDTLAGRRKLSSVLFS